MRRRILMGVAGAVLLIGGFAAGMIASGGIPAFAATNTASSTPAASTKNDYCQLYINTLAGDLGTSTSKLQSANADAVQKVLDQMQKDGKITAAQKTKLEQRLQKVGQNPCQVLMSVVGRGAAPAARAGKIGAALGTARQQIETAVAGALHIPGTTLQQDLANGQTIQQIASSQHVAIDTVNTAYVNAVKSALSSAQSNGLITQQQSSALLNQIQQAVNAGHYPGLEARGPKGAGAPPAGAPGTSTTNFFPPFGA